MAALPAASPATRTGTRAVTSPTVVDIHALDAPQRSVSRSTHLEAPAVRRSTRVIPPPQSRSALPLRSSSTIGHHPLGDAA